MRTENQPIEQFPNALPLSLAETNLIQAQLWEEDGGDWDKWIENNSQHFRVIIEKNRELAGLYRREPEKFKKLIKHMLKTSPTVH